MNNGGYYALKDFAAVFGFASEEAVQGTDLPDLDFVLLAKGQGCEAVKVSKPSELQKILKKALNHPKPFLVEVEVSNR